MNNTNYGCKITEQALFAGADDSWTETFDDYLPSTHKLDIYLKQGANEAVSLSVSSNDDEFIISYNSSQLTAGKNQFQYVFTNLETNAISVAFSGYVEIQSLLSQSGDTRSDDEIILDALIDQRKRLANREYNSVNIGNGKTAVFKDAEKLEQEIVRYQKKLGIYKTPRILHSFGGG